jgi:hypothetical protein
MAAAKDRIASIPSLRPDYDPSLLALSPAEGFLYSRIDGATPWKLLREIGGLSPDEVDLCLESWAATGLLDLREPAPERKKLVTHTSERGAHKVPRGPELSALDEGIDIDLDSQRRILEFEARLDEPYHELLGLERDFDTKMIKKAYFKLSKEFHPDRFFRRNVGGFGKRMEKIFKRISEAYELLSDPTVRAEIDKSMKIGRAHV